MKFEIKNNKIYRKGEEIKPDTSGTNGKGCKRNVGTRLMVFSFNKYRKNYNLQKGHH